MKLEYGNGPQLVHLSNITFNGTTPINTSGEVTDKSNLVTVIWAVNLTAFVLVGLFLPVRVIVRCTVTRNFFSDDVLVIIAALFTFGICSLLPIAMDWGLGQHYWNLDLEVLPENTRNLTMIMFIENTLYPCAIAFARLSAICSLLRYITNNTMRYAMYGAAGLTGGFAVASVFAVIFQCKPVSAAWDTTIGDASCYPFFDFLKVSTAIGIAIDVLLCTAPLPYFWKLKKLSTTMKIALTILFVFAGLACAAIIVKLVFLQTLNEVDVTYNWVSWVLCSIAECTIAIVCISIPPIVPLFTRCAHRRKNFDDDLVKPRKKRGRSARYTVWPGKPTHNRAVAPRVVRPMATPWKDQPVETTTVSEFHWLKLEQAERGLREKKERHERQSQARLPVAPPGPLPFSMPGFMPPPPVKQYHRRHDMSFNSSRVDMYGRTFNRGPQSSKADQVLGIAI
ncbi:hypothetical protein CGCTS75_v003189 [Colletotrichum tropicale]|nr:hypothetical protein CGCTS75_v003189 [Colletotrichum tropicale]